MSEVVAVLPPNILLSARRGRQGWTIHVDFSLDISSPIPSPIVTL